MTKRKSPQIATTVRFEMQEDLDRQAAFYRRNRAWIEADAERNAQRADAAREQLAQTPRGIKALANVEAIRANNPDRQTRRLAEAMDAAAFAAEGACERFLIESATSTAASRALHLTVPFAQELQKIAKDALVESVSWFEVDGQGNKPQGITHHDGDVDMLTSVIVYSTSRPGERWVVEVPTGCTACVPARSFDAVVKELSADCHCDLYVQPYAKTLGPWCSVD